MPDASNIKIVVLDGGTLNPGDNPWEPIQRLGRFELYNHTTPEQLIDRAQGADVLVTNKAPITEAAINALPSLRLIAVTATGHNIVDSIAARKRGIIVSNVPEYGTNT